MALGRRAWAVVGTGAVFGAAALAVPALGVDDAPRDMGGPVRLVPSPTGGFASAAPTPPVSPASPSPSQAPAAHPPAAVAPAQPQSVPQPATGDDASDDASDDARDDARDEADTQGSPDEVDADD